jgi:DnaJ-class molecular chaperone
MNRPEKLPAVAQQQTHRLPCAVTSAPSLGEGAVTCPECNGSGEVTHFARYAGEAVAGEFHGSRCEECEGTGEVDHICPPNRMCPECRSIPVGLLHREVMVNAKVVL